jgi:hypothetical protein
VDLDFTELVVPASRGLTDAECALLAPSFDPSTARPNPAGPPGATTEQFDTQRSAARARILEAAHAVAVDRLKSGHIPGSSFRNVHASVRLQGLRTRRLSMPTYVLAYRYKGRLYRALVHGQNARAVFGTAPLSWAKIFSLAAAALVLIAALALLFGR